MPRRLRDQGEWERLVQELLDFPTLSGYPDAAGCRYDVLQGALISFDSTCTLEVPAPLLADLAAAGILIMESTEFGEATVRLNQAAVRWASSFTIAVGSRDPIAHVGSLGVMNMCKLSAMMYLGKCGWRAALDGEALDYYSEGSELVFDARASRPKAYFLALALAPRILQLMMRTEACAAVIHHGLSDSYYRALLSARTIADIERVDSILAEAKNIKQLPDRVFAALVNAGLSRTWFAVPLACACGCEMPLGLGVWGLGLLRASDSSVPEA